MTDGEMLPAMPCPSCTILPRGLSFSENDYEEPSPKLQSPAALKAPSIDQDIVSQTPGQVIISPATNMSPTQPPAPEMQRPQLGHSPEKRDRSRLLSLSLPFLPANNVGCRLWIIARIEQIFENQLNALLANDLHLSITLRSRIAAYQTQSLSVSSPSSSPTQSVPLECRTFRFPGKSEQEAWRYSQHTMSCSLTNPPHTNAVVSCRSTYP
jgi:hypothetical protein